MGTMLTRPPGHRRDIALRPAAIAMAFLGEGQRHEIIAVPGVALPDGDVLVAIELSTICESDIHAVGGHHPVSPPVVLGHESVGRVIAIGDAGALAADGTPLRIGDRVVWSTTVSCASCDRCLCGLPQACRSLARYGRERIGTNGELTGAFGSHILVRSGTTIVRVPETLPAAVLAPAACATATAWAAVARARRHRDLEGARVRIHGAGLLGLSAAAIATEYGALVELRDPDEQRRAWAQSWLARQDRRHPPTSVAPDASGRRDGPGGRDVPVGSDGREVRDGRDGRDAFDAPGAPGAPDVVIETSGRPVAVAEALHGVGTGGVVVLAGSTPAVGSASSAGSASAAGNASPSGSVSLSGSASPDGHVPPGGSASPSGRVPLDAESIARRLVTVVGVRDSSGVELIEAVGFLAGRGRAYAFADAVGAVRPLADLDDAFVEASAPGAPLRVGVVPGR